MSSGEVQSFADEDGVEAFKHNDIASGLPFIPISLVSAFWPSLMLYYPLTYTVD